MNRIKRFYLIFIAITISLVASALFLTIFTDGIGVAIFVIFPFSGTILILLIWAVIKGILNRKAFPKWYIGCLVIPIIGIILWTPIVNPTRTFLERRWRHSSRQKVVDDIISGNLTFETLNTSFPISTQKYGRVSFGSAYINEKYVDNAISAEYVGEEGLHITFTTDGGFLGGEDQLVYIQRPDESPNLKVSNAQRISNHWYTYHSSIPWFCF